MAFVSLRDIIETRTGEYGVARAQARAYEHCKYLYEEENFRRDRLNDAVKVYVALLTFVLGVGVFQATSPSTLLPLLKTGVLDGWMAGLGIIGVAFSIVALAASLVLTILILKTWKFARLSDPGTIAIQSCFVDSDERLLSTIIADYVVATEVNSKINNSKASLLSSAMLCLIGGLVLFVTSLLVVSGLTVWG